MFYIIRKHEHPYIASVALEGYECSILALQWTKRPLKIARSCGYCVNDVK